MKMTKSSPDIKGKLKKRLEPTVKMFGDSKSVQILSGVFVLQLVFAGGLLWKSNSQAQFAPATQLVSVDPATVDEVIISDGDNTIALLRIDSQWKMNDQHETLAAANNIEKLLSSITDLKPGLPVSSTRGAHQQLEVTDDTFQRHVTLKAGDVVVADLYMGTSPGFRKSHVRQVNQDEVYAAKLNTFDMPVDHDDWLDQNLLSFDDINSIQSDDIDLALANGQWSIGSPENLRETHEVDKTGIDSVVSQLTALRVNGFALPLKADETSNVESASDPTEPTEEELITHTITVVHNDTPVSLVLSKLGSDVTIERSDIAGLFSLPLTTYDALTAEAIQQLLVTKSADESTENSQPQG